MLYVSLELKRGRKRERKEELRVRKLTERFVG